jgi:sucrose-phosphate synthase
MESKPTGLYLVLVSIHGLIRGRDLELGRDADTGGQTKYVVDLARALGECEEVSQVDLITRRVVEGRISDDYAEPVEQLSDSARIVRIDAGPDEYVPKEELWDHLDILLDNLTNWLNEQPRMPDVVHGHYPDAGYVGARMASLLGAPFVYTGHSLGRDKRRRLLASGLSSEVIEDTYNISRRIAAEEEALANADLVVTSTHNEIEEQYALYNYYDPNRMAVIPPGTDLELFHPPGKDDSVAFSRMLDPFLRDPDKPLVLALSRPDERKNIASLVEAFGESEALQEAANLLIVAGTREDIRDLDSGARSVLTELLLLVDTHDLHGKVALPKHHRPDEVPEIYRLAVTGGGVFINPALTEPFGLTLLEAAASGLPVVATENGGPVDIIGNCRNGVLVNPLDKPAIADAMLSLLKDRDAWNKASRNGLHGVRQHYTWQAHARQYLDRLPKLRREHRPLDTSGNPPPEIRYRNLALYTDLDQNLLGDPGALPEFADLMRAHQKRVVFGVATGRRIDSALAVMRKHGIPAPDVLISSLGTRIHYGRSLIEDRQWGNHIDHEWNRDRCREEISGLPGLKLQPRNVQSPYKLSWYYDPSEAPPLDEIVDRLHQAELTANATVAFGQFLDIVPTRASKGLALRYVALRFNIPLERTLVAGGSGADEDMMRGNTLAVVVANRHDEELSQLEDVDRIYFAANPHASGIVEAIEHYAFFDQGGPRIPGAECANGKEPGKQDHEKTDV